MSNQHKEAITAVAKLNARAKMGDVKAANELRKLRAMLAGGALSRPDVVVGRVDQQELAIRTGDDVELADVIAQRAEEYGVIDDLERKGALYRARQAAAGQIAPLTNTNPSGVFAAGMLGNQATVAPGELKQVVNYQSPDCETTTMTVVVSPVQQAFTLDRSSTLDPNAITVARPYARIQFGNKGFAASMFVDVGTGVSFDISGSMATIEVGSKPLPPDASSASGHVMQLGAMISAFRSSSMRTTPLTYTIYQDDGTGTFLYYAIPPFARRVTFYKANRMNDTVVSLFGFTSASNGGFEYDIPAQQQQASPVEIPGDTVLINAIDTTAGTNAQGRFVFELALG
jgi:hypothetical protein